MPEVTLAEITTAQSVIAKLVELSVNELSGKEFDKKVKLMDDMFCIDEWISYEDDDGNKFTLNIHSDDDAKVYLTMYKCSLNKDGTVDNSTSEILEDGNFCHSKQITEIFSRYIKLVNQLPLRG